MEFCPKCGMRLVLNQKKTGNKVENLLFCPKCGYQRKVTSGESILSKVIEPQTTEQIAVLDEDAANIRTMPITRIECPKCGNREAFWWMVQTRGADESTTQFFRCTKCNYTWREMA